LDRVASGYELKANLDQLEGNLALERENLLNAISFCGKQGMKEKVDSLGRNMNVQDRTG